MKSSFDARAKAILQKNDRGGYTVPTEGMYPHQWNWDSALVALGFATFDRSRAVRELETLFEGQWSTGMVPHIIFRADDPRYYPGPSVWRAGSSPPSSGISQPPVAASVAWTLWQDAEERERRRLEVLFPRVLAWHRWFRDARDPEGRGVVVTVHPWETGRDNSPEWDEAAARVDVSGVEPYQRRDLDHADASMRPRKDDYDRYIALLQYGRDCGWDQARISREGPFRMADVGMSMMLLQADRDLAAWAQALGYQDASAELQRAIARAEAGVQTLWDPSSQCFCSRDLVTGEPTGMVTSASFLAFYAGVGRPEQHAALFQHWDRIADRVDFMVPSFDPEHPAFDHLRYWRGPCWAVVNYMVAQGLERLGHPDRAVRVRGDTRALIRGVGFAEAFSPVDGSGTGGQNFSWTAAMWLAWASEGPLAGLGPTKLAPRLQTYAWGDERFLPDLLGVEAEGPVAEAWYGAHPRGPAMAERDGGLQPLDRVLAEVGEEVLGSEVQQRFGGLPYLIKILAMNKPLSIQVHPDRDQAAAGFAREEAEGRSQDDPQRFYRDERHKPELLVALRTTYALCGFRPFETILGALAAHPELRALLLDGASPGDVEALLHAYFSLPDAAVERALAELLRRLGPDLERGRFGLHEPEYWVVQAHRTLGFERPDRGLLFVFLLRIMELRPGQGVFLRAGVPHAYLSGAGVEIMANSDNVLRGGLTPKPVDPQEFLRIVRFDARPASVLVPVEDPTRGITTYSVPVEEFNLQRFRLRPQGPVFRSAQGPETVLLAEGHRGERVRLKWSGGSVELEPGRAALIPHGTRYSVETDAAAHLFLASIPLRDVGWLEEP